MNQFARTSPSLARPFLKWAGGKSSLLPQIRPLLPKCFDRYFEPFIGGGAMLFDIVQRSDADAYTSDVNQDLICCYTQIRDNVDTVIAELRHRRYDKTEYYRIRERFNAGEGSPHERAAWFIYMNKTGFNGLCRYSGSKFNVPFGRYTNPTICDEENLRACSAHLRGVRISTADYAIVEERANPGDLIYFDPPYVPTSTTANFTGYSKSDFGPAQQASLAAMFRRMSSRGIFCVLSNSDTPDVRQLYAGFPTAEVSRSGAINSKATKRERVGELLIRSAAFE